MTVIGRVDLPSGGWAELGDPDTDVKHSHFRRVGAVYQRATDDNNADTITDLTAIMAEAMVTAWHLPYAKDAAIPRDDPDVMENVVSLADGFALGGHLIPVAATLMRITGTVEQDPGKGQNGSTPHSGSNPFTVQPQPAKRAPRRSAGTST